MTIIARGTSTNLTLKAAKKLKMLTVRQRQRVLEIIQFCSSVNLFPTQVELQTWTLVRASSDAKWKARASKLPCLLLVLGSVYKVLSLLYTLFFLRDAPFRQLMIHAEQAGVQWLVTFWYYILQVRCPAEYSQYVKITLTGNISRGNAPKKKLYATFPTFLINDV